MTKIAQESRAGHRHLARDWMARLLSLPIHAYRYTLSPVLGHACRFSPSCSAYALEALAVHGPAKGLWLALKRIARCHPISWLGGSSGFDPVPPAQRRSVLEFKCPNSEI